MITLALVVIIATCGYKVLGVDVTWLQALYMTVVTLTSVGYGEIVETGHSAVLRIFNIGVLTFGIGLMLYVFSISTAFVVEGELKHLFWRRKMQKRIAEFRGHVIVCGAGETGFNVVTELVKSGCEVVLIDTRGDRLAKCHEMTGVPIIEGDATEEDVLEQAGLARAAGLVIALPADKDNLVVTVTVRLSHPGIRIVSRAIDPKMGDKIMKAGANSIVCPNFIGGMRLASEIVRPHVVTFLDLMLKEQSQTLRIEEIRVPYHSAWVGKDLGALRLREKYSLACLALRHSTAESFCYNPGDREVVKGNSVLVVMGDVEHVTKARAAAGASHSVATGG